jgi:hypothetical protein
MTLSVPTGSSFSPTEFVRFEHCARDRTNDFFEDCDEFNAATCSRVTLSAFKKGIQDAPYWDKKGRQRNPVPNKKNAADLVTNSIFDSGSATRKKNIPPMRDNRTFRGGKDCASAVQNAET